MIKPGHPNSHVIYALRAARHPFVIELAGYALITWDDGTDPDYLLPMAATMREATEFGSPPSAEAIEWLKACERNTSLHKARRMQAFKLLSALHEKELADRGTPPPDLKAEPEPCGPDEWIEKQRRNRWICRDGKKYEIFYD